MNYLELIRQFWKLDNAWQFTCCETRLYFYLVETANSLGWANNWTHSDGKTSANVGVSINTLKTARNRLSQAGLISFKEGGKGHANKTRYQILTPNLIPKVTPKPIPNPQPKVEPLLNKHKQNETDKSKSKDLPKDKDSTNDCEELDLVCKNEITFDDVWVIYEKKGNKKTSERKWSKLKNSCREAALRHIPLYVESTPDKQYRKNFETYINQEAWNDEIIKKDEQTNNKTDSQSSTGEKDYSKGF